MSLFNNLVGYTYFCFALAVVIGQKPIIVDNPADAYAMLLQKVYVRCSANGVPKPNITWYKEGKVVETYKDKPVTSNKIVNENQLIFMNLDVQDEGVYYCNATNQFGWAVSKNASVRIAYLETNIVGPEIKTASIGETVLMECKPPKGIPKPKVMWKFNSVYLHPNRRIQILERGDLRIDKATRRDSGRYSCVAKNFADERESVAALLTVRQKPYFKRVPGNVEVRVNEAAVFPCVVEGDPRPTIVWSRDKDRQVPSSRASLLQNKGLRINRVQLSDAGNYICQASNSAGRIEAFAKLSVISSPGFLETPESQEAREGELVRLGCRVSGSPPPSVVWAHNGEHFIEDNTRQGDRVKVSLDGSLTISNVKLSDSGKYECRASSYSGRIQSSAYLRVQDSLRYEPPLIGVPPQNQTLRPGLTATFHCKPQPSDRDISISWLKDGAPLTSAISDPRVIHLTSGTLKINSVRASDAGNYTCRASREPAMVGGAGAGGYTLWTVRLRVEDTEQMLQATEDMRMFPGPPAGVEVAERGDSWVVLKWQAAHDLAGQHHFLVQYHSYKSRRGWTQHLAVSGSPARIDNLQPGTGYRFLVRAVSELGTGRPGLLPYLVFTHVRQHFSRMNLGGLKTQVNNVQCQNLVKKAVSTDQITLTWRVTGSMTALRSLSGFVTKYKKVPLSRCLAQQQQTAQTGPASHQLEHCSLSEALARQLDAEMSDPRSSLNQQGEELQKLVPVSDWIPDTQQVAYTIVTELAPFVCYELCVQPYLDHPKFGRLTGVHSRSVSVLTYDSVPSRPPSRLAARWLSNSSLEVSWLPPRSGSLNGVLKGYSLHLVGNDTNSSRSIEVSPKSTSVRVQDLSWRRYVVHIAAQTCQGEGIRSAGLVLGPGSYGDDGSVLGRAGGGRQHQQVMLVNPGDQSSQVHPGTMSVTRQPWFIGIMAVVGCLWLLVCGIVVLVCRGMYLRGVLYKSSGYSNGTKLMPMQPPLLAPGSGTKDDMLTAAASATSGGMKQPLITNPGSSAASNTAANHQRRFHDSVSSSDGSNGTGKSSNNSFDKQKQRMLGMTSNNVAPYATAALLQQQCPMSTGVTSNGAIMSFSPDNGGGTRPGDFVNSASMMDWAAMGPGGPVTRCHTIPPPPEFPPPPAPVSPNGASAACGGGVTSTGPNLGPQLGLLGDDASYASCPLDGAPGNGGGPQGHGPASSVAMWASTAANHNTGPMPGYIDYSCTPYNGGPVNSNSTMTTNHHSDSVSIASSSFALPPPHDMLSLSNHYTALSAPEELPSSNGGYGNGAGGCYGNKHGSVTRSLHDSSPLEEEEEDLHNNGVCYGNKNGSVTRSMHDSSPLDEEDEDNDEMDDDDDDQGLPSNRGRVYDDRSWATSGGGSAPFYHQYNDEAPYDICPDDGGLTTELSRHAASLEFHGNDVSGYNSQQHSHANNNNRPFFPPPPPPPSSVMTTGLKNQHTGNSQLYSMLNKGPADMATITSSSGSPQSMAHLIGYLGETPIV